MMDAVAYDAWHDTPREHWIGDGEFRLLADMLRLQPGESLLDIGCGTGYFTRRFAQENAANAVNVVGLDPDLPRLRFARNRPAGNECYIVGDGGKLLFPDRSFDCTLSVTALYFAEDQASFLSKMMRMTKKRFVLGLLNRTSLLYRNKGRQSGTGAYRGARWHTAREICELLARQPVERIAICSGIFWPTGGKMGQWLEWIVPGCLPVGAFLVVAGQVLAGNRR